MQRSRERLAPAWHAVAGTAVAALVLGATSLAGAAPVDPAALIARQRATAKGPVVTKPAGPNPMLSFLPTGASPDHEAWRSWLRTQGKAKRASLPLADATRLVVMGESEPNNSQAAADAVAGFGSAGGSDPAADITGAIAAGGSPTIIGPFVEDNGAIPLANATGLTSGATVQASGTIGDGPHGSGGTATGDFDFFSVSALSAGDEIVIDVDTPLPFCCDLDPFVAVWDSAGTLLAFNDDDGSTYDSYLAYAVPAAGTYYVSIGAYLSPFPTNPFDPSSGSGVASEGTYDVRLGLNSLDSDFFAFGLQAGDVIAANLVAPFGARVSLSDPGGGLRIDSGQDVTFIEPGPFPGGGAATLSYVVETTGSHAIRVRGPVGAYTLELRVFRPALELATGGAVQTVFVDFNGATLDPVIFGGAPGPVVLSPLSAFLAGWGLAPVDESALIDAILAVIEENLSTDMRVLGLNGDYDLSGIPGDFDVVLLNSRDHADPFGAPNVSRLVIGGTIPELGIGTIGIAQSIDPGNFATDESAVVLLDLLSAPAFDPNSLNQFGLAGSATKIDLVAAGVGNIAAHEAGHFFANFHTDQFNPSPNVMDQGGNLPNIVGVGTDLTLGTGDDFDVDFGSDTYVPNEGFVGTEDTLNSVAFGLSTGAADCSAATLVPVTPTKLIVLDKLATASKAKAVFVAKDAGITKGTGTDPASISVEFTAAYANDAASGSFELPAGDAGWLANKSTVAKFVNKLAPAGSTEAKITIIKPGRLAKLVGKGLGDTAFDIYGAGDPAGDVHTAYCVNNGGEETCHCSTFSGCTYKPIAGDTGAKLVCKLGSGDAGCAAICP